MLIFFSLSLLFSLVMPLCLLLLLLPMLLLLLLLLLLLSLTYSESKCISNLLSFFYVFSNYSSGNRKKCSSLFFPIPFYFAVSLSKRFSHLSSFPPTLILWGRIPSMVLLKRATLYDPPNKPVWNRSLSFSKIIFSKGKRASLAKGRNVMLISYLLKNSSICSKCSFSLFLVNWINFIKIPFLQMNSASE